MLSVFDRTLVSFNSIILGGKYVLLGESGRTRADLCVQQTNRERSPIACNEIVRRRDESLVRGNIV
jgi:hypothetical protein